MKNETYPDAVRERKSSQLDSRYRNLQRGRTAYLDVIRDEELPTLPPHANRRERRAHERAKMLAIERMRREFRATYYD